MLLLCETEKAILESGVEGVGTGDFLVLALVIWRPQNIQYEATLINITS